MYHIRVKYGGEIILTVGGLSTEPPLIMSAKTKKRRKLPQLRKDPVGFLQIAWIPDILVYMIAPNTASHMKYIVIWHAYRSWYRL